MHILQSIRKIVDNTPNTMTHTHTHIHTQSEHTHTPKLTHGHTGTHTPNTMTCSIVVHYNPPLHCTYCLWYWFLILANLFRLFIRNFSFASKWPFFSTNFRRKWSIMGLENSNLDGKRHICVASNLYYIIIVNASGFKRPLLKFYSYRLLPLIYNN